MLARDDFYKIAEVKQHSQFQEFMNDIIFNKDRREQFYKDLLAIDYNVDDDIFRQYFEEYAAERKSNKQDFTPHSISETAALLTINENSRSFCDDCAGTGSLIVKMWDKSRKMSNLFEYNPCDYFFQCTEYSDVAIPYLIHNLAIRGMCAVVLHGNTLTREFNQIYLIQNLTGDPLQFSKINILPHTEEVAEYFDVRDWLEDEIDYKETTNVFEVFGNVDAY